MTKKFSLVKAWVAFPKVLKGLKALWKIVPIIIAFFEGQKANPGWIATIKNVLATGSQIQGALRDLDVEAGQNDVVSNTAQWDNIQKLFFFLFLFQFADNNIFNLIFFQFLEEIYRIFWWFFSHCAEIMCVLIVMNKDNSMYIQQYQ